MNQTNTNTMNAPDWKVGERIRKMNVKFYDRDGVLSCELTGNYSDADLRIQQAHWNQMEWSPTYVITDLGPYFPPSHRMGLDVMVHHKQQQRRTGTAAALWQQFIGWRSIATALEHPIFG